MALPRKIDIVETERVINQLPKGVYDTLMYEIEARNKRLGDSADAAFFGPYAYELLTAELRKERQDADKDKKAAKAGSPPLQPVQQSA